MRRKQRRLVMQCLVDKSFHLRYNQSIFAGVIIMLSVPKSTISIDDSEYHVAASPGNVEVVSKTDLEGVVMLFFM